MKKELREAIARDNERQEKGVISTFIDDNSSLLKALGIASAVVFTGFSAVHLVKLTLNKRGLGNQENFLI